MIIIINGMDDVDALVDNGFGSDDRIGDDRELRSARLDSTLSEGKAALVSHSLKK